VKKTLGSLCHYRGALLYKDLEIFGVPKLSIIVQVWKRPCKTCSVAGGHLPWGVDSMFGRAQRYLTKLTLAENKEATVNQSRKAEPTPLL
jgi:hypothetical protein